MTTTRTPGTIRLSSPDEVVAAIPHLLGYNPTQSIVLLGMDLDRQGQPAALKLGQRFDLPPHDMSAAELKGLAVQAAAPMARSGSAVVFATVFADTHHPGRDLPAARLVDELTLALDEIGAPVKEAVYTDGITRWSYGCEDPTCCPPAGRVIPQEVRDKVAAEFIGAGVAVATDRDALVTEIAATDRSDQTQVRGLIDEAGPAPRGRAARDIWRESALQPLRALAAGRLVDATDAASALAGLADIRVRDTAVWELMQPGVDTHAAAEGYAALVRSAPDGHGAPAATVLGVLRWTSGDGTRARIALDRALADNPEYTLGLMVQESLRVGLPPSAWREAMSGLTRDECRYGRSTPPAPARPALPRPASPTLPGLAS